MSRCQQQCLLCLVALVMLSVQATAAAAANSDASLQQQKQQTPQRTARKLLSPFTGAVGPSTPSYYLTPAAAPLASRRSNNEQGYAYNPAVGVMNQAMASGQAPSDIASMRARGYVRGKIMGQRVDAAGVATASLGNNAYGGVTGVADAAGQFQTSGPYGYLGGQGQARAAVATTREAGLGGYTVLNGAAAAQASGSIYGGLPNSRPFYARGSASAQAEGTIMYAT